MLLKMGDGEKIQVGEGVDYIRGLSTEEGAKPSANFCHRSLIVFSICFNWTVFFTIEVGKFLWPQCIKFNLTIILLKRDLHLIPHAPSRNTEEEKCYEMFNTFKPFIGSAKSCLEYKQIIF